MILYAPNVNSGGGLVLLSDLLHALQEDNDTILFLDARVEGLFGELVENHTVFWVQPKIGDRIIAERVLAVGTAPDELVLCFNGVPPLLKSKGRVVVYVQNKLLISSLRGHGFRLSAKLRLAYEKFVLWKGRRRVSRFLVQTASMHDALVDWLTARDVVDATRLVHLAPFANRSIENEPPPEANTDRGRFDFCYVADGQPHKNHDTLFEAMRLLAEQGIHPKLAVTLGNHNTALIARIDALNSRHATQIENLGVLTHADIFELYANSDALVFPSLIESFGMPLIEASRIGLPIIAGELDYVRDVCTPQETFNPELPRSLSRALLRFLGSPEPIPDIPSAKRFLVGLTEEMAPDRQRSEN